MLDQLRSSGFRVYELPAPPAQQQGDDSAQWNGVSETQDAAQTIEQLPCGLDWLIVDHYSCGNAWEKAVRPYCQRLGVIDDLARLHTCDLLIDPNWVGNATASRYEQSTKSVTVKLLGPTYAFISKEYLEIRSVVRERNGDAQRIFVYFGGSDVRELTRLTLRVLSSDVFSHLDVDVVIGATAVNRDAVRHCATMRPRTIVHENLTSLAPLLAAADLAIGAVGGTTWERMYLGVPTVATILADNQREIGNALAAAELLCPLDDAASVNAASLTAALADMLGNPSKRYRMADAGRNLVDGRGINRIVESMRALS